MARTYSYSIERTGRASAETTFALLRDVETWTRWAGSPITFAAWKGGPLLDGVVVGRTRLVGTPQFQTAEEVTADEPPYLHGYRIPARWPVRDYAAEVHLIPEDDGVLRIVWSGTFIERIPGTGVLWKAYLRRFLGTLAARLLDYAEHSEEQRSGGVLHDRGDVSQEAGSALPVDVPVIEGQRQRADVPDLQ